MSVAEVAVVGGSGLYELAALEDARELRIDTPFGAHSDGLRVGRVAGRAVAFLARHGREHRLLPGEINHRANVFALKTLGVERLLSASAVGSLRAGIHPRDVVLVDQFVDRAAHRPSTFFGGGVAVHVAFADPVCPELRGLLQTILTEEGATVHPRGTYVCIEGPAFSTRAESQLYRTWGADVIGMTNLPEAKLAREAEICYATLGLVTDYDCWHEEEEDVSVAAVVENLRANAELAGRALLRAIACVPAARARCTCAEALRHAILTPRHAIPEELRTRLAPLLRRHLDG